MKTNLLLLILLNLCVSCLPSIHKSSLKFKPLADKIQEEQIVESAEFRELKTNLLAPKCLACHASWNDEALFQYKLKLGNPEDTKLFELVKVGKMPVGPKGPDGTRKAVDPVTSEELERLRHYIEGAKAVPLRATFENLKAAFLQAKCFTCHKRWSDEAGFLKEHVKPGSAKKSDMYLSVKEDRMPKSPKNPDGTPGKVIPLPESEKNLLRDYINHLKRQAF